jgi:nucleoid-associated protein EbfC
LQIETWNWLLNLQFAICNFQSPTMFKGLSNLAGVFKAAQQLSGQMDKLAEEMKTRRTTGSAGGGMVEIEVNGMMEVLGCRIDPQLSAQNDRELVEDLVVAAMNQAISKAKQMHAAAAREMTGGLQLPGLDEALGKLTGIEATSEEPEEPTH